MVDPTKTLDTLSTSLSRLPTRSLRIIGLVMLLMVQKSQTTTWDGAKTLKNNGINYQPQPVIAGFLNHQQSYPSQQKWWKCKLRRLSLPPTFGSPKKTRKKQRKNLPAIRHFSPFFLLAMAMSFGKSQGETAFFFSGWPYKKNWTFFVLSDTNFCDLCSWGKEHPSLGMPSRWNGVKTQLNGLQQLVEVAEEGVLLPIC